MKPKLVILEGSEPIGTTVHKISALRRHGNTEIHLVYWQRKGSPVAYPLSCDLDAAHIHPIEVKFGSTIFSRIVNRIGALWRTRRYVRALDADIIQVCLPDMLAAMICPTRLSARLVFDLQDTTEWMRKKPVVLILRWLFRRVNLFVTTAPQFITQFLQPYRLLTPGADVVCVPNSPSRADFRDFRRRADNGEIVVGYIGTFRGGEALLALEKGIVEASEAGVPARGFFAGTGLDLNLVLEMASRTPQIEVYGPYSYSRDIRRLYEKIDVVYAVYDDSADKRIHHACRLSEAIVCGLPIIVMEGTYMAEIVRKYGVGFEVPLGAANAVAAAISALSRSKALRDEIAHNCSKVSEKYFFEYYTSDYLKAFDRMLGC